VNIGGVAVSTIVRGRHEIGVPATLAVRLEKIVITESGMTPPEGDREAAGPSPSSTQFYRSVPRSHGSQNRGLAQAARASFRADPADI
jgi:hypothetical protein